MGEIAKDVQAVLDQLAQHTGTADASLGAALEAATRLILSLVREKDALQSGVFEVQGHPAVRVSDLFPRPSGEAADAWSDANAFLLHQHILHNPADGITVQDVGFNIVYQSSLLQHAFGCHVGEKCYAVYEKRSGPCEGCGLAEAFHSGTPHFVLRTATEADGTTSCWENVCYPIFDEYRHILGGVEVCRNVSDRVSLEQTVKERNVQLGQLNEELKQEARELAKSLRSRELAEKELCEEMQRRERLEVMLRRVQKLKAIGQLASGLAHEINTPAQFAVHNLGFLRNSFLEMKEVLGEYRRALVALNAAPGYQEVAQRVAEAEKAADLAYIEQNVPAALTDVSSGLARISTVVQAMRNFGHAGRAEMSHIDVNRALQATLSLARTAYADVADLETDFQPLPPVFCHAGDMHQVFLNLLVNAAQAIGEQVEQNGRKGLIRVRTAQEDGHVRVDIQDTGHGIAPEVQEHVFDPFFTTREIGRGSGLGLAIAYSLVVEKHHGSLTFETQVGRGTTFTILLPIEPADLAAAGAPGASAALSSPVPCAAAT